MDEWTNFPGFGPDVLALEEGLVRDADLTIVSADRLAEKWGARARQTVVAKNGVDLQHYRERYGENDILGEVRRPVIGYFGALASWVDVWLLAKIAAKYPNATLVLAGGHFDVDLSAIASLPNVSLLGQRPYGEMPQLLWNFDVCIIPFFVNAITEATNPVKFYEYLFGGKPVVAPDLPELRPYANVSYLARNHEEFLAQIDRALAEPLEDPRRARRREIAAANDWQERYRAIHEAIASTFPLELLKSQPSRLRKLFCFCRNILHALRRFPALRRRGAPRAPAPITRDCLYDVVCLPIIEWGFRFQRPQQLMSRFADAGHRVFYVAEGFRPGGPAYEIRQKRQNVYEVSLRGPARNIYTDALDDAARDALFASLDALRRDLSLGATAAFVQLPFWWPLAKKTRTEFGWPVIYDCMDDHLFFSTNRPKMIEQENDLLSSADLVTASSRLLEQTARDRNAKVLLLPNACDYGHFAKV
ncbi:MAG: glycosyltransferase, partial [Thermoanaerobaculia bacterium]